MTAITAAMVSELRAKTDAPMMECKRALTEAEGDMAKAEEILRVKLGLKASKASSRVAAEGIVAIHISGKEGAILEVNSETDFVAKNDDFLNMANAAAKLIAQSNPADVEALGQLDLDGKSLEQVRADLVGKIGENMSFRRFKRFSGDHSLTHYAHGAKIGVVIEYTGDEASARDVAMHIAAMKPVSLSASDIPEALLTAERNVAKAKALESGKPEEFHERMIEGAVQKYLKESCLLEQPFVKDDKKTVTQMLKEKNTTIHSFTMYVVGEGIEKKVDDFAAEVAAQVAAAKGQ